MKTWDKDPGAVLDYVWDFTEWLGTDQISTYVFEASTGIVIDSHVQVDGKILAWISGGVDGIHETVTCKIETAGGRKEERTVIFKVKQR